MINITEEIIMLTGPWSITYIIFIYNLQYEHMISAFKITNFHLERENSFRKAKQLQRVDERVQIVGQLWGTITTTRKGVKNVNFCGQV